MDTGVVIAEIEAAVRSHVALAGGEPAVEAAAESLLGALGPALRVGALRLAEQAALEVRAQLSDATVEVTVVDGEPAIAIRQEAGARAYAGDELDARLTLRLPGALKGDLEDAAGTSGDSINSYIIKALSSRGSRRARTRESGVIET